MSNAISRTSREWHVRICITFICIAIQKPFWPEFIRTVPMCRVTMKKVNENYIKGSFRKKIFSIFDLNIFIMSELSGKNWNWWEFSQWFFDASIEVLRIRLFSKNPFISGSRLFRTTNYFGKSTSSVRHVKIRKGYLTARLSNIEWCWG